jgi:hypothetical protein
MLFIGTGTMHKCLLPLIVVSLFSGCRSLVDCCRPDCFGCGDCCGMRPCFNPCDCQPCNCRKPALNALGMPYDGSGSPCYRSPGPFWCWLPGPCSTCRDPWVVYYDSSCKADFIGRHVSRNCHGVDWPPEEFTYASATEDGPVEIAYDQPAGYDPSEEDE